MEEKKLAEQNQIIKIRTGSHLYGTETEKSDEDFVGVFIPPREYVLGLNRCEQVMLSTKTSQSARNSKGDIDYTVYSLIKFIHLAIGNNPNIIELFFVSERCLLQCDEFGKELLDNYKLFISKKAYHTFKGYAYAQRKKLEIKKENMTGRKELALEFGYDTKFASHLIRLLLEGLDILIEGKLQFPLPQNNLVRDIKLGKRSLEWVLNKAEELEKLIDTAYITSDLQKTANIKEINKLQIDMLERYWAITNDDIRIDIYKKGVSNG